MADESLLAQLTPAMRRALIDNVDTCGSPRKWRVHSPTMERLFALELVESTTVSIPWRPTIKRSWRMTDKGRALAEQLMREEK